MRASRRLRSGLALAGALLLLAGCGLPLGGGVRSAGQVPEAEQGPAPISVLPPGPQPGASPQDILRGFLTAQSSPREQHGVARTFLLPAEQAGWDDEAGVVVYEPGSLLLDATGSETEATVRLTFSAVGSVGADGAAATQRTSPMTQLYRLRKDAVGAWRLAEVPAGLTLSPGDRDRSYAAASVMFISAVTPISRAPHLVPDRVLLSVDGDRARRLVEHVLQGPSTGLGGSGTTAAPPGTRLDSVGTNAAGEVLVQLSDQVLALPPQRRRDLAAQLVWTLRLGMPDFSRLRLEADGRPLDLDGESGPYPRTAFAGYDPEGAALSSAPTLALVSGRVEVITDEDVSPRFVPGGQPVTDASDAVADVRTGALAVLTGPAANRTLLTGSTAGALSRLTSGAGLASPTWGDGSLGVWLLRTGADPAILRVPLDGPPVEVPAAGLPPLGSDAVLRVSRDGARVALVSSGRLYVGRVEPGPAPDPAPRVVGLRQQTDLGGARVDGVRDVAWVNGTELAVLVSDDQPPLLPLLRRPIDGTSTTATGLLNGAESDTVTITAFGALPLLVETQLAGVSTTYSGTSGAGFQVLSSGMSRPRYPD